ncbi:MAG TPA: asparagine synthase-related protein, partial [Bacillus sp. (in: firmicutes)]|nr:asparagine synthase-related protein [Bacillus sp. (in: firmicutes)]
MSVVLYSPRGKSNIEEEAYNVFDETFASTTDLLSYQVGNYIIVVFEDMGNNIEVLLKLLRTHSTFGDHLLQSLQGSFSFLIYDRVIKKIDAFRSLAADPIFYYQINDGLFVSNNLKSLTRFSKDLDEDYFRLYLHTEMTETEHTPYKKVKRLLPAHKMTKNKNQELITKKFWSIPKSERNNSTLEDHINTFSNILTNIVRESVLDQQVIGCEISGGLDSSSVSCLAEKLRGKDSRVYGYTYIFDKRSDGKPNKEKVEIIYQNTSITPKYLNLSNYWSFKDVQDGITNYDEPSALILNFAMFRDLNRAAKEMNATVLLSGEGGDELLLSSSHYLRDWFFQGEMKQVFDHMMKMATKTKQPVWKIFSMHILPALLPIKLRYRLESQTNKPTWKNTGFDLNWYETPDWIGDQLKKVTYEEVEVERRKIRDANIESIYLKENFERLILVNPCPWLNNNFGKPAGLNRIYPFRDQRLIEFVFSLPSFAKLEMSHKKRCIREGLQNTIPREIIMKPDNSFFT